MNKPQPRIACSVSGSGCNLCGFIASLLNDRLRDLGVLSKDRFRVSVEATDLGSASYPYLASIRVDGREVYRVESSPSEAAHEDVLKDVKTALSRG